MSSIKISQLTVTDTVGVNDSLPIARGTQETFRTPASQFVTQGSNIGTGTGQLFSNKTSIPTTLRFRTLSAVGENLTITTVGNTVVLDVSGQNPIKTTFVADGSAVAWPLIGFNSNNAANYRVDFDGVLQEPFADYILSGNRIVFATPPLSSTKIVVVSNNFVKVNEAQPAPNTISPGMLTTGRPVWDTGGNLTVTSSITAASSITAGTGVQIYKSSIGAWISLGDKQLTYDSWIFDDNGGQIIPSNRTRQFFYGTGSNQTFIVPTTSNYIYVKLWGAGGAGGTPGGWTQGSHGGAGGHTRGLIPVTPGETLTLIVGKGGLRAPNSTLIMRSSSFGFGGGHIGTFDNRYGGQGGGGSFIFRNYVATTPMPGGIPLLIAGGGGGGGSSRTPDAGAAGWGYNDGGAGGGLIGSRGVSMFDAKYLAGGQGGTQTAPGSGGTLVGFTGTSGLSGGGSYTGNTYAANNTNQYQGGTPGSNALGGAGGGGWYGGGGGAYSESNTMAGGGGGSGYIHPSIIFGDTHTGMGRGPAYAADLDIAQATENTIVNNRGQHYGLGFGGGWASNGFDGLIVIYY